ncbi:Gluconolactonase precursor [Maioricimonas rarisocia]|uniref:Gluconolactonase n=1 Tax=Maioricimonas rarisocia TaxID=2528026 RepID=A0A517Z848_9PLAN|nr:SMP-30/gluconolactonase/LRE family protein [Maioricimonas rarisocia]QDU38657.1 Gluconolactonase precursor [Maioricimonas rarisocia]
MIRLLSRCAFVCLLFQCCLLPAGADDLAPGGDPQILPANSRLEMLWNEGSFTEGVAVAPDGTICFSDIPGEEAPGKIFRFDPATGKTTVLCPDSGKSNGLMFDREGRLIAACGANRGKQALCEITEAGEVRVLVGRFNGKRFNSPNDLVIHPDGSIYFSDPRYVGPEPVELDLMSVYRYVPSTGTVTRVTTDISKPNGVVLSPNARVLYVAETDNRSLGAADPAPEGAERRMTLNAFPVRPNGTLGPKRVMVDFGQENGIDGMTVDVKGNIYAAVRSEARHGIAVYSPAGKERAFIPTKELPTNCCFGIGDEANRLYVTIGTGLYRIRMKNPGYHPATADAR